MITTGSPDASLLATCGSDPIDLAPPFGGKHGTRLKISPADFATCFTFSIALAVRLFCCGGLALSDLGMSVDAGAWAAWAACARAGRIDTGVSSISAATAGATSNVILQKGLTQRINARSSILLGWIDVSRVDHKFRERAAKAIVNALGQFESMRGAEQVEIARVVPVTHD